MVDLLNDFYEVWAKGHGGIDLGYGYRVSIKVTMTYFVDFICHSLPFSGIPMEKDFNCTGYSNSYIHIFMTLTPIGKCRSMLSQEGHYI